MKIMAASILAMSLAAGLSGQNTSESDHHAGVVQWGKSHAGMGFSQTTATHHSILTNNGGIIQVTANDLKDTEQIKAIQTHLAHIAAMFSEGNFAIPHFVHGQAPPCVSAMKEVKGAIPYSTEPLSDGGRVKIETSLPEGIAAVQDFLKFQIKDHQTGDPVEVQNR